GLLFLTLVLKTLPGGYMLVASEDGWPRLALCSGVAALPAAGAPGVASPDHEARAGDHAAVPAHETDHHELGHHGSGHHGSGHHESGDHQISAHHQAPGHDQEPGQHADMPCPFAALAAPALPPAPLAVAAAVAMVGPVPLAAVLTSSRFPALAAPPPPATGPPHFV
ncbi:MAG: hypothetical protein JWN69_823, partial [Alphaproteobacteria bacterium]|nr:hypothetical protein [Alphaproteobacteria bacterium]